MKFHTHSSIHLDMSIPERESKSIYFSPTDEYLPPEMRIVSICIVLAAFGQRIFLDGNINHWYILENMDAS